MDYQRCEAIMKIWKTPARLMCRTTEMNLYIHEQKISVVDDHKTVERSPTKRHWVKIRLVNK